jgi:hypothetical protein
MERWRPWLVNALVLEGGASLVAAGFWVSVGIGLLVLGGVSVLLALLIHWSGGDGPC